MFRRLSILTILGLLAALPTQALKAEPRPFTWRKISEDLDAGSGSFGASILSTSVITAFRTSLKVFHAQVLQASDFGRPRMSARSICEAAHAALCVNANFFDPSGKPLGLVVSRGIVANPIHKGGNVLTGIFAVTKNGISISGRDNFDIGGISEALQAGPRLISSGRIVSGLKDTPTTRRSGICRDKESRLIIYVIADSWSHSSIADVLDILRSPDLGCVDALNLDGGGSSQLFLGGLEGVEDVWFPGRDDVPIALALSAN